MRTSREPAAFSRFHPKHEVAHMSLLSNTIAAAERAPLPDALVRAGISALVGRTATRFAEAGAAADAEFAAAMAARAIAEHTDAANAQHYEVPAAFFAQGARTEPEIFLVLLPRGRIDPAGGRGRGAEADRRACRSRRRPGHSRARLRLGLAVAVDGGALSERAHHRRLQLALAAAVHRGRGALAAVAQPQGRHRRHERVRSRPAL